jgi:hypothetical protein
VYTHTHTNEKAKKERISKNRWTIKIIRACHANVIITEVSCCTLHDVATHNIIVAHEATKLACSSRNKSESRRALTKNAKLLLSETATECINNSFRHFSFEFMEKERNRDRQRERERDRERNRERNRDRDREK